MTAQAGLSSTNLITPLLNTLRGAPFSIPALYGELHTAVPGANGTTAVSAANAFRYPVVMAPASGNAIALQGNPPMWLNGGFAGEKISFVDLWSQAAAGTFNTNGTFYLSAPISAPVTWNANDTISLTGLTVGLGPVATADQDGLSAALIAAWLNTMTGIGGTSCSITKVYAGLFTGRPGAAGATNVSAGSTSRELLTFSASANNSIAMNGTPPAFTNGGATETLTDVGFFCTPSGATVSAPTGVSVTGSATGGTLAAREWFWVVTATNFAGETVASSEVNATLSGGTSSAALSWTLPAGASGVNVYRGTTTGEENVLVAKLGAVTTYTDTGAAGTSVSPPGSNTATSFLCSEQLAEPQEWSSGQTYTLDTFSTSLSPAALSA